MSIRHPGAGTTVLVSRGAFLDNVRYFQQLVTANTKVWPVIKADGYGHGAVQLAAWLQEAGLADTLCVTRVCEVQALRAAGITLALLLLQPVCDADEAVCALQANAAVTAGAFEHLEILAQASAQSELPARVHIKIDSGMHRIGFAPDELPFVADYFKTHNMQWEGLYTHFASADETTAQAEALTKRQLAAFEGAVAAVRRMGYAPVVHAANTAATLRYPASRFDAVRVGLGLYGYAPAACGIKPVLSWRAPVAQARQLCAGDGVSYGWTFIAPHDMTVATVAAGYADGFARSLSRGVGQVLLRGCRVPVLGNVCMDQMIVEVPPGCDAAVGDEAWLLGGGQGGVTADEMALWCKTLSYEVLVGLGPRVSREYVP